jgi:sulfur carrier protein
MNITVNGINENIENIENNSLVKYLEQKKISKNSVVIELNERILKKDEIDNITLKQHDKIEIIRFIGGG